MNVSKENAEQYKAICRRMRPIRFCLFYLSTAIATIVLPSAPRPRLPDFFAADEKFINFNTSGQFFPILTYSGSSQLLQPTPGCVVAAKS
jgi:hypothetical protein